ncbi:MAG: bifunctional DNA primase/polymerase [Myxococcales bacterium]
MSARPPKTPTPEKENGPRLSNGSRRTEQKELNVNTDIVAPETEPSHLSAALALAAQGLRVLPLVPRGKDPIAALAPHGVNSASDDPATIAQWWTEHPDANVGLAVPRDWLVLDVDPRNGGAASYNALQAEHGELPPTLEAATGGGGAHIVYAVPIGSRFPGKLKGLPGIDLLGTGRYIVAWPSVHPSGARYTWTCDVEPAPPPEWLARLERGVASAETCSPAASDRELSERERASLDELAALLEPHAVMGQRNALALAIGGTLRNEGLPPSAAEHVMAQLSSDAPEKRLANALRAWRVPNAAGESALRVIVGDDTMAEIDRVDLSPEWIRRYRDRVAARAAKARPPTQAPASVAFTIRKRRKPPKGWLARTLKRFGWRAEP